MSTSGAHVRTIGEGVIDGKVVGVAASADVIAVGVQRQPKRVILFSIASGAPIRSFGDKGMAEGELSGIRSLRFSPDGGHLIVTESKNNRLSLFTLSGVFVRCIGVGTLFGPLDTDFSPTGDILVADFGNDRVCVFCADGALLRTFGKSGTIPGKFQCPMALGVHGGHLYVLDNESARVQVFS